MGSASFQAPSLTNLPPTALVPQHLRRGLPTDAHPHPLGRYSSQPPLLSLNNARELGQARPSSRPWYTRTGQHGKLWDEDSHYMVGSLVSAIAWRSFWMIKNTCFRLYMIEVPTLSIAVNLPSMSYCSKNVSELITEWVNKNVLGTENREHVRWGIFNQVVISDIQSELNFKKLQLSRGNLLITLFRNLFFFKLYLW